MDTPARILVVDDEVGIQEECRRVLVPQGFEVDMAENSPMGLRKLRESRYDVLLLDIMMPGMSSIEVLRQARQIDPDLICIIITGYATVELAIQAVREGAHDFIVKPFSADLLLQVLQRELERRALRKEAERVRALEEQARELARAKEELERLDRFKTTFMLTVAHELRAPLTALQSFLLAVLKGYIPPEEQQEVLGRAVQRVQELLDLVDDLLKLAAAKSEKGLEKREPVSLADVLEKVAPLFQKEAEAKGLAWAVEIGARPMVWADPDQMAQVWSNLISNAVKYTPKGGRVRVALEERDGWAIGTVEDSGIGIPSQDLGRIFEEFYRTPQAKEVAPHGTGLGLPLVKQILEAHGGSITVESEVGRGSRFVFRLPVSP